MLIINNSLQCILIHSLFYTYYTLFGGWLFFYLIITNECFSFWQIPACHFFNLQVYLYKGQVEALEDHDVTCLEMGIVGGSSPSTLKQSLGAGGCFCSLSLLVTRDKSFAQPTC